LSNAARDIYLRAGVPQAKVVIWPNFLTNELDSGGGGDEHIDSGWLYVGRIGPEKGIERLAKAWPPGQELAVIGDGPDVPKLRAAARGKSIRLEGLQPRSTVIGLMRRSVGLVFPSLCLESFPMTYVEAMAVGLPVLAWEPNAVAELVRRERTGRATSWGEDLPSILLQAEPEFRQIRSRCRQSFDDRLSERAYVSRAERLYRSLLDRHTRDSTD
jgi:glycosyltransferase involved in cell wall biosynthesis